MELKDYLKLLGKSWLTIALITVIFGVIGYLWAKRAKPVQQAITTFQVTQKPQPTNNNFYTFDNFYSLSSTGLVIDQIVSMVTSPNTVIEVYEQGEVVLPTNDPRKLTKVFRVQKGPGNPNSVSVFVQNTNAQKAVALIDKLKTIVIDDLKLQQERDQLSRNFNIAASDSQVTTSTVNLPIRSGIFALVGLIVSSGLVLLKEYLS